MIEQLTGREHGRAIAKRKQMLVSRDERHAFPRGDRNQVIVAGICRTKRRQAFGIRDGFCQFRDEGEEPPRINSVDPRSQLRTSEHALGLRKQGRAHDELELALQPLFDEPCRSAGP